MDNFLRIKGKLMSLIVRKVKSKKLQNWMIASLINNKIIVKQLKSLIRKLLINLVARKYKKITKSFFLDFNDRKI